MHREAIGRVIYSGRHFSTMISHRANYSNLSQPGIEPGLLDLQANTTMPL